MELGTGRLRQALGSTHHKPGFLGWWVPRPACRAGWRARELLTLPCAGRDEGGAEDLPRSSEQCIPQPRPRWRPAAVALTSAGQAELAEPRALEGGAPGGRGLKPPGREDLSPRGSHREKLFGAAGGQSFPLRYRAHRTRTAWCGSTSPARTRSTRFRCLLFAARLCLGPGSYHGMWGCPWQALEPRPIPSHWHLRPRHCRALRQ